MDQIEAYKEVLAAIEKHKEVFDRDYEVDIRGKLESRITANQIANDFGITLDKKYYDSASTYMKLSDYCYIALFDKHTRREISWSDDGRQPENEWLYAISFPTGAYIFGDSYPTSTFNDFLVELKSYNPKYSDTHNNNLYFTKENAKKVHEDFGKLLDKYRGLAREELKISRIRELEQELSKLTGNS